MLNSYKKPCNFKMLIISKHFITLLSYFCLFWMFAVSSYANDELDFSEIPAELNDDVSFWLRIYTELNSQEGLLHDSENLRIVYGKTSDATREIESLRLKIAADLEALASTKDDSLLTKQQISLMDLWGRDTHRSEFSRAAKRIRWQKGQSDIFSAGLGESTKYQSHGLKITNQKSLPDNLLLIPHLESSFNTTAKSSANALGMWQFTKATGQEYMQIDDLIDERLDPYLSTRAGLSLLEDYYQTLNSWPLAITAYNHGITGIRSAVQQLNTTSISDIVRKYKGPRFGFASRNFFVQFLAVNYIVENLEKYFPNIIYLQEVPYEEYRADSFILIDDLAEKAKTKKDVLIELNPSFLNAIKTGLKEIPAGYLVKLPVGSIAAINQSRNLLTDTGRTQNKFDSTLLMPQYENESSFSKTEIDSSVESIDDWVDMTFLSKFESINNKAQAATIDKIELNNIEAESLQNDQTNFSREISSGGTPPVEIVQNNLKQSQPSQTNIFLTLYESDILEFFNFDINPEGTIELQPNETLSDIAYWLGVKTWDLRNLNNLSPFEKLGAGEIIDINVDSSILEFERKRLEHHSNFLRNFLDNYRVIGTTEHFLAVNDNLDELARNTYKTPMWLLAFYNPDIRLQNTFRGQKIIFPIIEDA